MRRLVLLILTYFLFFGTEAISQRYQIPGGSDAFLDKVRSLFEETNDPDLQVIGEDFVRIWPGIGLDHQDKIIKHVQKLDTLGYRFSPYFETYFISLVNAVTIENLSNQKLTNYLLVSGKVIDNYEAPYYLDYFRTIGNFFEHRAIYYSNYQELLISNDDYDFEYVELETLPESVIPEATLEEEDTQQEEVEDRFEDWDTEPQEDDWGTDWGDNDGWGDSGNVTVEEKDQQEVPELDDDSNPDYLVQEIIQPVKSGAIINFSKVDLTFSTPYDSSVLDNTSGFFIIKDGIFVGENGKFDWSSAGLSPDSVFVELTKYNFEVDKGQLSAEKVNLTYKGKLDEPVEGVFEYNGKIRNDNRFPRFKSYRNDVKVNNIGKENLDYTGGFSLHGDRILSSSVFGGLAKITVNDESGKKFKSRSKLFEFKDSLIVADRASIVIFHGSDSIYHPTVRFHYNTNSEQLVLLKDKGGFKKTPYQSSYFSIDFIADILRWDIHSDSLNISILNARNEIPALFESQEYFDKNLVSRPAGIWDFDPLQVGVGYAKKHNNIYVNDLAKYIKRDERTIKSAMLYLMWAGFIDFNVNSGKVTLKEKAYHTIQSKRSKKDYDNLKIRSLTSAYPNATLDFEKQEMVVRGINRFYISEILDVYIEPDSNVVTLLENRNFKFNGKLYAGNFEYIGHDFTFNYDQFLVELNQIDSIQFYVVDEDSRGSKRRKVDNALSGISEKDSLAAKGAGLEGFEGTSGTLYINKPDNKSARKIYPNYPQFDGGGTGSIVYFDGNEYLNGAYDRSIYFLVPPFKLDSLSDSDPSAIGFQGTFGTSGILPDFKEKLEIQPDYSLGFQHMVPPEGYQLFDGDGRLYNQLNMDKEGLRGNGKIEFLTTTLLSDNFVFYVDSMKAVGTVAETKRQTYNGVDFPDLKVDNYSLKWFPRQDNMLISNNADPIKIYQNTATLDGTAVISTSGVKGAGILKTRGSETKSRRYTFMQDQFFARKSQFEVKSSDPDKPALAANNAKVNFNLIENYAEISPEVAGEAVLEFPFAQFKTSIPNAVWDLDSSKVRMSKPDEYHISDSYFYTTREELDSLVFNATDAVYDINSLELKVSGIPYITVADSRITPENGQVLILENARIGTLHNTTLVIDTLNGYHRLYDGTIDIISRNEFEGEATYEFVNAVNDTFAIKLTDFRLEDLSENKRRRELHTVANGDIAKEDNLIISPGMFYKGDVKMYAHRPFLELDGYVKLNLKKIPDYDTWISYYNDGEQEEVIFNFDESLTEGGQKLTAGLHYDIDDYSLYSTFITDKRHPEDEDFFRPGGYLSYNEDSSEFIIADRSKQDGSSYAGKIFAFNEETGDIRFEGPLNFIQNNKARSITASGLGTGNIQSNEFSFNSFVVFNFDIPTQAYDMMGSDIIEDIKKYGASEGLGDKTQLLYKVAEIIGDKATKQFQQKSLQEYTPLVEASSNLVRPFVFSNIDMEWSDLNKAFYSVGKLGMSNILRTDINGEFEGFLEITKKLDGEKIDLFFKVTAETWYYFGFDNNRLLVYSSNNEFNQYISSKSNSDKAKIGEFVFLPAEAPEVLDFVNRFRKDYMGIDEPYILDAPVAEEVVKTPDDFGGKKKDEGFEDEEDDGF